MMLHHRQGNTVQIRALNSKGGPSDIGENIENGFLGRRWPGRPATYLGTRKSHFPPFKIGSARRGSGTDRPYQTPLTEWIQRIIFSEENGISFQYPLIKSGLIWKAISCGLLATKPTPDVAAEVFPIKKHNKIDIFWKRGGGGRFYPIENFLFRKCVLCCWYFAKNLDFFV